jgi:hypothetical protein
MALNIERSTDLFSLKVGEHEVRNLVGASAPWSVAAPKRRDDVRDRASPLEEVRQ